MIRHLAGLLRLCAAANALSICGDQHGLVCHLLLSSSPLQGGHLGAYSALQRNADNSFAAIGCFEVCVLESTPGCLVQFMQCWLLSAIAMAGLEVAPDKAQQQ